MNTLDSPTNNLWHVQHGTSFFGPLHANEIVDLIGRGIVTAGTMVSSNKQDWFRAADVVAFGYPNPIENEEEVSHVTAFERWFVHSCDGNRFGPLTDDEILKCAAESRITANCLMCHEGESNWRKATELLPQLDRSTAKAVFPTLTASPEFAVSSKSNSGVGHPRQIQHNNAWLIEIAFIAGGAVLLVALEPLLSKLGNFRNFTRLIIFGGMTVRGVICLFQFARKNL